MAVVSVRSGVLAFIAGAGACLSGSCIPADGGNDAAVDAGPDALPSVMLPVNCRDTANAPDPHCTSPTLLGTTMIGAGPRFVAAYNVVHRGFVDGNRVVAPIETSSTASVIVAVDLDTGDRTVISGQYSAGGPPIIVGTGNQLPHIFDIQGGPDGWYALGNSEVWRIDPSNGNRTRIWSPTSGTPCMLSPATAAYPVNGIAVGADATLYLPVFTTFGTGSGTGIVAITATRCTLVSHAGEPVALNRGTGPAIEPHQLTYRDGKIWSLSVAGEAVGYVDPVTGNRSVVSSTTSGGSGPRAGTTTMALAADGRTMWTACGADLPYVGVDTTTGIRTGHNPAANTPLSVGGGWCTVWAHPRLPLLIVEDVGGFVLYDTATGNSNVLSY